MIDKEKSIANKLLDIIETSTDESRSIDISNYIQFLQAVETRQRTNLKDTTAPVKEVKPVSISSAPDPVTTI